MKKIVLLTLLTFTLIFTGCDSSSITQDFDGGLGGQSGNNGDGTYVDESVVGDSFILPENVSVTGLDGDLSSEMSYNEMVQYSDCVSNCALNSATMTDQEITECMMDCLVSSNFIVSSGAFSVAITLQNSGTTGETVRINAGTVLSPDSSSYQPMMLIQDIDFYITAGNTETYTIPVYCIAPSLSAPDETNSYTVSGVTTNHCLLNILNILDGKNIGDFDFTDSGIVQESIWNCILGTYSQTDTDALNALR